MITLAPVHQHLPGPDLSPRYHTAGSAFHGPRYRACVSGFIGTAARIRHTYVTPLAHVSVLMGDLDPGLKGVPDPARIRVPELALDQSLLLR